MAGVKEVWKADRSSLVLLWYRLGRACICGCGPEWWLLKPVAPCWICTDGSSLTLTPVGVWEGRWEGLRVGAWLGSAATHDRRGLG
jgi:hypothetical protein